MAIQGFSTFQNDAQNYIAAQTLKRIKRDVIVYGMGKKEKLPNRFSKTFQFTRYEKLDLPYAALTEGETPSDNAAMSISTVQAVMDQWGSYINLTDVAVITAKHPVLQEGIKLLGEQASETIDRECIKLLQSNSSVIYGGDASSRVDIASSDVMSTNTVRRAVSSLRSNGAHPVSGRLLLGLIDPSVEMDMSADSTFQNAASYSNIVALYNGEVGTWMGVRWMCSNLIPTLTRLSDASTGSNAVGGSLSTGTNYYIQVTAVLNSTGFEVATTQVQTQGTGTAGTRVTVVMPATTGRKYNVYAGSSNVALYLHSSLNAPGATVNVDAIPSSGNAPPAFPNTSITVHYSWIMGAEAFAVPELMSLQTFLTPASASDSDPLAQRRKASWKVMFKPVICNEDFIKRIESYSNY